MKAKDIDKKEIKVELRITLSNEDIEDLVLNSVDEDEEIVEESLTTFIRNLLCDEYSDLLDPSDSQQCIITIKDKHKI